tara:strand:- start:1853 stop:2095 length:243 start_codon:yes stop_codon:yes gene_type:complete
MTQDTITGLSIQEDSHEDICEFVFNSLTKEEQEQHIADDKAERLTKLGLTVVYVPTPTKMTNELVNDLADVWGAKYNQNQ